MSHVPTWNLIRAGRWQQGGGMGGGLWAGRTLLRMLRVGRGETDQLFTVWPMFAFPTTMSPAHVDLGYKRSAPLPLCRCKTRHVGVLDILPQSDVSVPDSRLLAEQLGGEEVEVRPCD